MQLFNAAKAGQKLAYHGPSVKVHAVCAGVLRYHRKLRHAAFGQAPRLVQKLLKRTAYAAPAYERYRAVGAAVVAAVRNAQVSAVGRGGDHPDGSAFDA